MDSVSSSAKLTEAKDKRVAAVNAGSRDKMPEMRALADAFGIRLREVPIPLEAHEYMRDVLANTSDVEPTEAQHSTALIVCAKRFAVGMAT